MMCKLQLLKRWSAVCALVAAFAATTGCGSKPPALVAAPNLYIESAEDPYASVPEPLRTITAQVLYATDRQPEQTEDGFGYGYKRSHELSFGRCTVRMGKEGTTWEELVKASTTADRPEPIPLAVVKIEELGRYQTLAPMIKVDDEWVESADHLQTTEESRRFVHKLLAEELAKTPRKEVYLFVHGYNNKFPSSAFRTAQIWHFIGRQGVPVAYSWPAGSGGPLRGYTQDRESGEFTNGHLKTVLRAIATSPDVQKMHLIGHSRGTDILSTALRELHLECRAAGKNTRAELKLGHVVLAAPDLDLDVFLQKFATDRVGFVPERLTIYVSPNDKAIGISAWLFRSARRIGQLAMGDLGDTAAAALEEHPIISVVDVRAKTDKRGHGYFLSSPAVLSDLILVLRDHRKPGAEDGRPLIDRPGGFWELRDGYPTAQK